MNRKTIMCVASVAILLVCSYSLIAFNGSSESSDSNSATEPNDYKHKNFGMMILANEDNGGSSSTEFSRTYTVNSIVSADEIPVDAAVIVDDSWYNSFGKEATGKFLTQLYERGTAIATFTDIETFMESVPFEFVAYSESANFYAAYHDPVTGRNVFCSISTDSDESTIAKYQEWATEYAVEGSVPDSSILKAAGVTNYSDWGKENYSCLYKKYSGYGWMNINTCYYALNEDNDKYNYYCTRYDVQSVPDGSSVSDLNVYTKLGDEYNILQYGPTTTSGVSTASVSLGVASDGLVSTNLSWSYAIGDVIVKDKSNYATREFRVNHDLNEDSFVGNNTFTANPGKIVRVDCDSGSMTGTYSAIDHYEINFCKKTKFGSFVLSKDYKEFSEDIKVVVYLGMHTANIYMNGATNYAPEGVPETPADEFFSKRVSEGGNILVDTYGYSRTGYTMAGFSEDMSATTPEYKTGTCVKMSADKDLYMIWAKA